MLRLVAWLSLMVFAAPGLSLACGVPTRGLVLRDTAPNLPLACAVPPRVELRNDMNQAVRAVFLDTVSRCGVHRSEVNALSTGALPPGRTVSVTLPSCIGVYQLRTVGADGRERGQGDITAGEFRVVALR